MTLKECKENKMYYLRKDLEEDLNGLRICDYISRKDLNNYLKHFDEWSKTAKIGDAYYAQGFEYVYTLDFEVLVWRNEEQRDCGEPIYMNMTPFNSNLEDIKREVEKYDIESTGCIEIKVIGEDDSILHYEDDKWTEVA